MNAMPCAVPAPHLAYWMDAGSGRLSQKIRGPWSILKSYDCEPA